MDGRTAAGTTSSGDMYFQYQACTEAKLSTKLLMETNKSTNNLQWW